MANTDKAPDLAADQNGNGQKSFRASALQILAPLALNTRISRDVIANHWTCHEEQFLDHLVLFPRRGVLHDWMLRVRRGGFFAVGLQPQNK